MRHGVILKTLAVLALAVLLGLGTFADSALPSLFWNDEGWYKDGIAPLIVREGKHYVPADLFSMLESISVTAPQQDNLLLTNTATGAYVSILFSEGTAAVNGEITDKIGVFRDGTVYYLEAEAVAEALNVRMEILTADGSQMLRLTDGREQLSMNELFAQYTEQNGGGVSLSPDWLDANHRVKGKRLHILCVSPEPDSEISVMRRLYDFGIECTVFLRDDASETDVLFASACGAYGVVPVESGMTVEAVDARFSPLTHRRATLALSAGDDAEDDKLRAAGYLPLKPDFVVTGQTDPAVFIEEAAYAMREASELTVLLTDTPDGWDAAQLLRDFVWESDGWVTVNLAR